MNVRYSDHIAWQLVDDQAVIVDLRSGRSIGLNPTASFIWSLLANGSEDEIVEAMTRQYDIDRDTALRDFSGFVAEMMRQNLVQTSGA